LCINFHEIFGQEIDFACDLDTALDLW